MPITFGSVGDIIATFQIAVQLLTALNESRGSAREIQDLTKSLSTFHGLLEQLVAIWPTRSECPQLEAVYNTILSTVLQCREEIRTFLDTIISKYGGGVPSGDGRGQKLKHMGKMLQWHIFEGGTVAKLQEKLDNSHGMIRLAYMCAQGVVEEYDQALVTEKLDFIKSKQLEVEQELDQRLEGIQNELIRQTGMLEGLTEELRRIVSTLSPIVETGVQIKNTNNEMSQMIQALYQFYVVRPSISAPLDPYRNESVILEDALGYSLPLPIQTIRSWKVVKQILIDKFSDHQGGNLVKAGRYIFQDPITGSDLSLTIPFHRAVRPGQKIVQTMVFYNNGDSAKANTCPRCATVTLSSGNQDINCSNPACDVTFRRVTEVSDNPMLVASDESETDLVLWRNYADDFSDAADIEDSNIKDHVLPKITPEKLVEDSANVFKRVRFFTRWQDSTESRGPKELTMGGVSFWGVSDTADDIAGLLLNAMSERRMQLFPDEYILAGFETEEEWFYSAGFLGKSLQQSHPVILLYSRRKRIRRRILKFLRDDGWLQKNGFLVLSCSGLLWKKNFLEFALEFLPPMEADMWKRTL